jgi:hypothetical protein
MVRSLAVLCVVEATDAFCVDAKQPGAGAPLAHA